MAKAKKSKLQKTRTLVTFLLDRTGSMESIKDDTIGGFNAYLKALKDEKDAEIDFSLLQFDSTSLDKVHVKIPVASVPDLTSETFQPRHSTPLIDAAYKTIKAVEEAVKGEPDTKVVICIMTDGQENSSKEYTTDQLSALVKEKTALGWQFNFMGASIDAYAQASQMGIGVASTISYNKHNRAQTTAAFSLRGSSAASYASGMSLNASIPDSEKLAVGDVYFDKLKNIKNDPTATAPTPAKPAGPVDDFNL